MIEHAGVSEQGHVRHRNEDSIGHQTPADLAVCRAKGCLFVVADGVGGSGAGDVASREAVQAVMERYYDSSRRPDRALQDAVRQANLHVYDLGMRGGKFTMETTLSALAVVGGWAHIAHVGDSRIYRVRGEDGITQLTRDHSEVAELVRMQILTPEAARHHFRRHIITRSLGSNPILQPMFRTEPLLAGDTFLLCTDGLWEPLEDREIARIVSGNPPAVSCRLLIELGMERQSTDNLSVHVVRVVTVDKESAAETANHNAWWRRIAGLWKKPAPPE